MRRLAILVFVILLLIIGGGLTAQIASQGGTATFPWTIRTTNDPDASVMDMTPWKAEQLFLLIGFILFNLIGAAVTVAVVFWLLHREVKRVKAQDGTITTTPPNATEQT